MTIPRYYEDLNVLHENTEKPRAYFVPASKRMHDLDEHRENSDRLQSLNGNWKFKYFESVYDVQDEFWSVRYDTQSFDEIPVPSVWQMFGYDNHQYTNIRYPFPFDPPYVPVDIPCGAYVHKFDYTKDSEAPKAFLNFEGVDSCYYVWLNGKYVGYDQVSHMTGEFDVTDFLTEGENTLAVLVLKWCDGSYLEDQDKFRMSGIFRDVYILKRPQKAVRDYSIKTKVLDESAEISVKLDFYEETEAKLTLETQDGEIIGEELVSEKGTVDFKVDSPVLWNTENPYLYTLVIETDNETITEKIAIRTIEIKDKVIYLNGQKIKSRGVNRHDSDPKTGFTISVEKLKKDLTLMKEHNFNAIRSSHYPNEAFFYQMCDKYGFMVIDEADIEAHGPFMLYRKEDTDLERFSRWNEKLADDPKWEASILDRVQRMLERDKNRFSIVMWSMGNESAYGCNFEKALEMTKKFDPDRITQYESARYRNYNVTYNYDNLDIYSRMYPSLDEVSEYLEKDASKPFLLVEYCHSMGNGPGDFEDYFEMIQKHDIMCGGFVWEWCDHAIAHGMDSSGRTKYYYGGDHDEEIHDGNFCMDGLVYPDRRPHTGLLEYKNVYRPARVVSYNQETGELVLHNYMDFDDLEDYVDISYELTHDGVSIQKGKLSDFSVKPHEDGKAVLNLPIKESGKLFLKLFYRLKKELPLLSVGHELGFDEILLKNADSRYTPSVNLLSSKANGDIKISETDSYLSLKGTDFTYVISKKTGLFEKLTFAGTEFLTKPMQLNIWRAPTDNDMYIKNEWKKAHYDKAYTRAYKVGCVQNGESVKITADACVVADTVQKILDVKLVWAVDGGGKISLHTEVKKDSEFPVLPRFGVRMFLDKKLDEMSYFGMGPQESYSDKHRGAYHGLFRSSVKDNHEDYIKPQENGSHYDCEFAQVQSGRCGIALVSEKPFSFNASNYTQEMLEKSAHNFELEESDSTVLCADCKLNGIGSNSCGPTVIKKYQFDENEFEFDFEIIPFVK